MKSKMTMPQLKKLLNEALEKQRDVLKDLESAKDNPTVPYEKQRGVVSALESVLDAVNGDPICLLMLTE